MLKTLIATLRENDELKTQLRNEKERANILYTRYERIKTAFDQLKNQLLCETCQGKDCQDGKTIELCSACSETLAKHDARNDDDFSSRV